VGGGLCENEFLVYSFGRTKNTFVNNKDSRGPGVEDSSEILLLKALNL
jgi:hypothetical protein